MIAGVSGRLISVSFAESELPAMAGHCTPPVETLHALDAWSADCEAAFGPASSVRAIADGVAIPLFRILGFSVNRRADGRDSARFEAAWRGTPLVPVTVLGWNEPLDAAWRDSILDAVRADERWSLVLNGTSLRIVDAHRTWSRHFVEFDLALLAHDANAFALLWRIARAESLAASPRLIDRAVDASARHGTAVCHALGDGVLEALELLSCALGRGRRHPSMETLLEQSLTVLYRVLFLLFGGARARSGLASRLSRPVHDRFDCLDAPRGTSIPGCLERHQCHLEARPRRLHGRRAEGDRVQRTPVFSFRNGRLRPAGD